MALFDLNDRLNSIQAARFLGCSQSTLNRYVAEGRIGYYGLSPRCRFFLRSELADFLRMRRSQGKKQQK